jgi:hypothetical protein
MRSVCILTYGDSGQCHHMIGYITATGNLSLGCVYGPFWTDVAHPLKQSTVSRWSGVGLGALLD